MRTGGFHASAAAPGTLVKSNQALLPHGTQATISEPEITIHETNAVVTSNQFVHFYAFNNKNWVQTTTVSLGSTHNLSIALHKDTAVVGVPWEHTQPLNRAAQGHGRRRRAARSILDGGEDGERLLL